MKSIYFKKKCWLKQVPPIITQGEEKQHRHIVIGSVDMAGNEATFRSQSLFCVL
jgi:hypothetical protein